VNEPFVHLHVHSEYSLLESTCVIEELANKAKEWSMPALALTDNGNMFGAIEHYFACKSAGVKPILGLEVYLAPGTRFEKGEAKDNGKVPLRKLVLLAQNFSGYQNLCRISTIGYQEGFYYRPRVDDEVLTKYGDDLIALSGGLGGDVAWNLLHRGTDAARARLDFYQKLFGDRFYLEVCRTGLPGWRDVEPFYVEESRARGLAIVAANDVHWFKPEDQRAQEVLICIASNKTLGDESRYRLGSDQFYFKGPQEMAKLFADRPDWLQETVKVADRIELEFRLKDASGKPIYHLPSFAGDDGATPGEAIRRLAHAGLEKRFVELAAIGDVVPEEQRGRYRERLDYELKIIDQMGFNGYFLIVQDFINWSKANGIPVGPGRGSGAGSLVAYSLRITDINPVPYNLLFERFLNPERISMPDFDIDFCQDNRGRVIEYVTRKYGEQSVSQIITYGRLQTRAAIRDVGRVLGMTFAEVDVVAKLIPEKLGITIKEAIEQEPRLRESMENDPQINTLMDLAQRIEGLVRHAGIHAAGVIIADGRILDHAPLYRGVDGENVVQYDMKYAEKLGLIKFDFLGLKTLTLIKAALGMIERNHGAKITTEAISIHDRGIYQLMCKGDTLGVFQFEGEGITDLIRRAQPTTFEDIVAINALYRPGPMDMIPDYLDRKSGRKKVEYLFPELEPFLKETYGVIVYQEQVLLIAAKIANYSLGEADMLRRAMGKKIPEEMAKQKQRFLQGAAANRFDPKKSEELFDLMAEFANYGFNKSHAAAYCVVAAQTAFLKHYYPVEFYAALLSTEMNDTDKVVEYVKDALRHDLTVAPPHINESDFNFRGAGDKIYFSLGAIKGVGESAVEAIVEARAARPGRKFADLEDFFATVDLRRVNKKTIECLIKAGAFDSFGYNRKELSAGYVKFIDRAARAKEDAEKGQASLFDSFVEDQVKVELERQRDFSRSERLALEKEVLGFYLSDHPLVGFERLLAPFITCSVPEALTRPHKSNVRVAGLITSSREIITKKGTRMAFAQLEDLKGTSELVVFPDTYSKMNSKLETESPVLVVGAVEAERGEPKIIVESVEPIDEMYKRAKRVVVRLSRPLAESENFLRDLKKIFEAHPGDTEVRLSIDLADLGHSVEMDLKDSGGIRAGRQWIESMHEALGGDGSLEIL
jgi:DNA polymerase-3 subunit alpha